MGSIQRPGVRARVTLGDGEGRKNIKEKELKDKDRWFFGGKVRLIDRFTWAGWVVSEMGSGWGQPRWPQVRTASVSTVWGKKLNVGSLDSLKL